jgi:transcriptional regulator with XRE-family HTH domain
METVSYDAEIRHDGRVHAFTIPELHIPVCQACGEKVFTESVEDQEFAALRAHLHLLSPEDMRKGLERLNLTQKEAAKRIGIAEATLSHWLTDTQIQSRAMDNLLRLFLAFAVVRDALPGEDQDDGLGKPRPATSVGQTKSATPLLSQSHRGLTEAPALAVPNSSANPVNRIKSRYSSDEEKSAQAAAGNGFRFCWN